MTVSPVAIAWVVVALNVDDVVLGVIGGPAAVSPVAVTGVVVALDVESVVLLHIVGSPAAVSPPAMAGVVVALNIDGVGVDLLAVVVVPETVSVDAVVDNGSGHNSGAVVHNRSSDHMAGVVDGAVSGVDSMDTVDTVAVAVAVADGTNDVVGVLRCDGSLVGPVAVGPVAVTGIVAALNIVGILGLLGEGIGGDAVLHLAAQEDLGEGETDGVTELIEVLVVPLCHGVHDFVVDILSIDNKVMLNVEDEVPRVSEGLGHLAELVEVSADGSLALLELVGDVVDDVTEVLDGVEDGVEGGVLELVNDTAEALPDVLGITEALDTVRNFSLDGTGEHTLKNLAHAEESEVDVRALHGLEVVHLLVLLVIDLVEELLPVVVEVEEEFLVVNHLGLSVKEHGGGLAEVLTSIDPLAHAVVMKTLTGVLEDVHTVHNEGLVGLEEDLLGVEESLSHALDLLVVVVINFAAVVEHVTDVGDGKTKLVDGLGGLLVRSIPEATHGVLEVLLDGISIGDAVSNVGHAVEVEGTDKEALNEASDLGIVMRVVSLCAGDNHSGSESTIHLLVAKNFNYYKSLSLYL